MKNKLVNLGIIFCLGLPGTVFSNEKLDVVTTISVGILSVDLNTTDTLSLPNCVVCTNDGASRFRTAKTDAQIIELGVTVVDQKLNYGFNALLSGQATTLVVGNSTSVEPYSRSAVSAYIGYSILDELNLYGGITTGYSSYGVRTSYEDQGTFFGARYTFRLGASSSLSLDASYAIQTSDILTRNNFYSVNPYVEEDVDNNGLSLSLTWTKALDRGRSFFVRYKTTDITYDGSYAAIDPAETSPNDIGHVNVTGHQKFGSLTIGMGF